MHLNIFKNEDGKPNKEEFETKINNILQSTISEAGKVGLKSLDKNNKEIGIDGSKEVINRNFNKNPDDELNLIAKEITVNANNKKLSDDLTLIVIGK